MCDCSCLSLLNQRSQVSQKIISSDLSIVRVGVKALAVLLKKIIANKSKETLN